MGECNYTEIIARVNKLEERLTQLEQSKPARGTRSKRAPSKYNLFLKKCLENDEKDGPITERFKRCVTRYKQEKDKL